MIGFARYRRTIRHLTAVVALCAITLTPHDSSTKVAAIIPIPFSPLDGGKPVLPDILVTALTALPNGTVYAGGHVMVRSSYAFAEPPVVPSGSVWLVSHDDGAHWTRRVSTTRLDTVQQATHGRLAWSDHRFWPANFTVTALAVTPGQPATIYAAGCTGSDVFCHSTTGQQRLLRSTDGGATWNDAVTFRTTALLYTGLANLSTNIVKTLALDAILRLGPMQLPGQTLSVLADPLRRTRVYACMSGIGVLRSDDATRTWHYSDNPQFGWENGPCDLLIDPHHSSVVYSVDRLNGRVFRSADAGRSWALASDFGYKSNQHLYNPTIVNGLLYITGYKGIYSSADDGRHWRLTVPNPFPGTMVEAIRGSGGWIAAYSPTTRTLPTGLYGKKDGQPWRLLAATDAYGPAHLGGAIDYQAMQAEAQTRLWIDRTTHIVFTGGAIGGLWRWKIGL